MALSDNMRGTAFMCASMFAFTVNDSFMKAATQTLPLYQTIAMRGALATLGLMLIALLTTGHLRLGVSGPDRNRLTLRTFAELASTATFLTALMHMPLANLSAIMQALPLAVTLAAALWLREPIGWRRMTAITVGFVGVMIIIRPGPEGFDRWALLGLASVAFVVLRDLATRNLSRSLPSVTAAIWAAIGVTLMGICGMFVQGWHPVAPLQALQILGSATMLTAGYMFAVMVMRVGDIGVIAPFRYTALLWAILFGWLIFGTLPDNWTLFGAAIVVATGLFTLLRERKLRRVAAAKVL